MQMRYSLTLTACLRHVYGHDHVCEGTGLSLVFERHRNLPQYILVASQCDCVDKEQAVSWSEGESLLHRHRHSCAAVLGCRDCCKCEYPIVFSKKCCRLMRRSGCILATTATSSSIQGHTKPCFVTHGGYSQYSVSSGTSKSGTNSAMSSSFESLLDLVSCSAQ